MPSSYFSFISLALFFPLAFIIEFYSGFLKYKLHPLNIMGRIALYIEKLFYKLPYKIISGIFFNVITVLVISAVFSAASFIILYISPLLFYIFSLYILASFLSAGGLRYEALKIYKMLKTGDINGARENLPSLAGRDSKNLNSSEISRAVVESVSENTGDGIGSVAFYFTLGGIIGLVLSKHYLETKSLRIYFIIFFGVLSAVIYKTANLLDSIVGYRNKKYEKFGKFSARLDDVLNFIPFRISALFMMLSIAILSITLNNYNLKDSILSFIKFRKNHPSPNGGQLESVTAGSLNIKLGGINYYGGAESRRPVIGFEKYNPPDAENIIETIIIMESSSIITALVYTAVLLIIVFHP
ncbi:MAG: adenosylcobinamide-phosphate synthase CbiB [Candidatus Acidulodesulfobacterium sp.]